MKLTHSSEKQAGSSGQWGSRARKSGSSDPSGANTGGKAARGEARAPQSSNENQPPLLILSHAPTPTLRTALGLLLSP